MVYPMGLVLNAGVVFGVYLRLSFSGCTEFPCFEPSPPAQTILHCLLRHLLQLQMSILWSRLDVEFLLSHMCFVKFKEIVVGVTLLRRSEVLVDLFRHDMRLWKVYSYTLQSAFGEYLDLLEDLEEELSSVPKFLET